MMCFHGLRRSGFSPIALIVFTTAIGQATTISGIVTDPQSKPAPDLQLLLLDPSGSNAGRTTTDRNGRFSFDVDQVGTYTLQVSAPGFQQILRKVTTNNDGRALANIRLGSVSEKQESITVAADIKDADLLFPDPSQRLSVRDELLDANPGRPGAPISIPGLPIETASGGIKAPQYFSPGVAGDHGEPIAEYIQVGTYLVSNNLSSNAHGNGYADPNVLISETLEGVQTDGGAFNVREGNHAENLSAVYQLHSRLDPNVTVTGDYRDIDVVSGWSPGSREADAWLAIEAAYGNGFLDRLEHRQQYKLNGFRVWRVGQHEFTLFGIGYYGFSFIPGLVPLHVPNLHDTIDSRQKDQTHTGEIALNDSWKLSSTQHFQLSGLFRTYNLSLLSDFGDGLIRQSEFRTVTGANVTYTKDLGKTTSVLAGVDYQRDAPRRLDLDHDEGGSFQSVTANNVTLGDTASFLAVNGTLPFALHYYLGWRRDEIQFDNQDLLQTSDSYSTLAGFNSPKATLSFLPVQHPALPTIALSFGEAFYTNDPRIGTGMRQGTPVSREHSYQLVASKRLVGADFRVVLGHVTTESSLAKIDPDTGLQQDQGAGRNKFVTVAARRYFPWGSLEVSVSKADARDLNTGAPTPEAPRLILDAIGVVNRLPFGLQARAEFEEVGARPLGDGFLAVPVREFRGAVLRSFRQNQMDVGIHFLLASGYTGQTTEVLAVSGQETATEQVVGVRLSSYLSASYAYRFHSRTGR